MQDLKSFNGRKVKFFNDDEVGMNYIPKKGETFIFQHEESNGEFCKVDHFYICCVLENGIEKCRWNAMSKIVTYIEWDFS